MTVTDEMIEVAAKAFFRDGYGTEDYPFTTWEEQFAEFKECLAKGEISEKFIKNVYDWNKDGFN